MKAPAGRAPVGVSSWLRGTVNYTFYDAVLQGSHGICGVDGSSLKAQVSVEPPTSQQLLIHFPNRAWKSCCHYSRYTSNGSLTVWKFSGLASDSLVFMRLTCFIRRHGALPK